MKLLLNIKRFTFRKRIAELSLIMLFCAGSTLITAQVNQLETDQGIAASIAPYDADVRQAILQVSQYPQVLEQLQKNQAQSVAAFQQTIQGFRQKKQEWFYTLTRYPDLLHTLATAPAKQSQDAIYKLLPNQNADLQEAAWKLYKHEKEDLVKVDNLNISAHQNFDRTIQGLDPATVAAFKRLSTLPDVLTLLTNNIDLTTRLGQHYKSDPAQLNSRLAALHDSLNVQDQYEMSTFKKQMESDPEATQELGEAAKEYAEENGYNLPAQQSYDPNNDNYYANPYSYWFGYPSWYATPLWYPGSLGYESGFYMGVGGFGFYGFPSYGFSAWFFNGGYYNRYPHLYRQFGNYYRSNISENRYMGGVNHGFMRVAGSHYNPSGSNNMRQLTSPSSYQRAGGQSYQNVRSAPRINAATYHAQSWNSYGGRGNAVGAPRGGGGFRGGGGGGSRGGGGRR